MKQCRNTTLTTCYRTTAAISKIVEPFGPVEDDPLATSPVRVGVKPRVVDVTGPADETDWVVDDIRRRLEARQKPGRIAILAFQRSIAKAAAYRLQQRGLQVSTSADCCLDFSDDTVKVVTMNSAKGLEFPVAYISPL